ncbi:MAG: ABC transporter permease [Acidimicrobiia bacterium]
MTTLARHLRDYGLFVRMGFKSRAEYNTDFVVLVLGVTVLNAVDVALLVVLLNRFEELGGWSVWEVAFLYSMYLAALGVENTFMLHLTDIEDHIKDGTLDQMLVRPSSALVQMLGKEISQKDVAHIVLGAVGLWVSAGHLDVTWGAAHWLAIAGYVLCGAAVLAGVVLSIASIAFWTTRSRVFLYGTGEIQEVVQHYPAHVFGRWFLGLVTFLLPFAAINFYPVAALLAKDPEGFLPLAGAIPPVAAAVTVGVGATIWRRGIRVYQSTGS